MSEQILIGGARCASWDDWRGDFVTLEADARNVQDNAAGTKTRVAPFVTFRLAGMVAFMPPDQCADLARALLQASAEASNLARIMRENLGNTGSGLDA